MRKIVLVTIAIIAFSVGAQAQPEQGNYYWGTTLGATTYNFGTNNYDYSTNNIQKQNAKQYLISANPSFGVFLTDHLILGGTLDGSYSHNQTLIDNTTGANTSNDHVTDAYSVTIGPFARYYFFDFKPTTSAFYAEVDAGAGTGGSTGSIIYNNLTNTTNESIKSNHELIFEGGGGFGLTCFLTKTIGLDIGVTYLYTLTKYTNTTVSATTTNGYTGGGTSTIIQANEPQNGFGISVGFHFMLE